jgi:hypothetical protein
MGTAEWIFILLSIAFQEDEFKKIRSCEAHPLRRWFWIHRIKQQRADSRESALVVKG